MLAGLDGGNVPRAVQGIGERVVDRLDLAVGEDVGVGAERSLYPGPPGSSANRGGATALGVPEVAP